MGKKSKTPKAPNYKSIALEQEGRSKDAWNANLNANRADQNTAFGSTKWDQDPTTGEWTQNTTLAPEYEAMRKQQADTQGVLSGKAGEAAGGLDTSQIDFGGAPAMPTVGGYNQQVIDTLRKIQAPEMERARAAKEAQLTAMGVGTGSGKAWDDEQSNIGDRESRADLNAIMAGINQGNTEFTQGMDAHRQGISDITGEREANIGQVGGLMALGGNVTNPQFADYYQGGPYQIADLLGAATNQYGASLDKTNAANADKSSGMQALGTVASIGATIY